MKFNKMKKSWVLGIAKYECKRNNSRACPTSHSLYYSLDFGITWQIIANRVI